MKLFAPLALALSAAGQTVDDCDINVEVTKTTTYNTILNFGPYNPYFAAFMKYVLKRTFEKIFSNIRDGSDGTFDFGDVVVTDIKAQQDPSCNTGTWCTDMNLAISVPTYLTYTKWVPCEEGSGSSLARVAEGTFDFGSDFDSAMNAAEAAIAENLEKDSLTTSIEEQKAEAEAEVENAIASGETEGLEEIIGTNLEDIDTDTEVPPPEVTTLEPETSVDVIIEDSDGNEVNTSENCQIDGEGGLDCGCDPGFSGDICLDINECNDNPCADNEECTNVPGSYYCTVIPEDPEEVTPCPAGYTGEFPACVDIDECANADTCGDNQTCDNLAGTYSCSCDTGYTMVGDSCVDVNECLDNPCENAACTNTVGSFECSCYENFISLPGNPNVCVIGDTYDCYDGTNGGCSHYCTPHGCRCPSCWELGSNGRQCGPSQHKLSLTCSPDAMTVNVDQCVYGGDEVKLSFEDESCGFASKSGDTWTLSTALDGCGTDVANSDDKISFTNTLEVTERSAALVLFPDPAIDFTCDFSSVVSGISANHQIAADKITTEGSSGVGSFQYELDFMIRTPQGEFVAAPAEDAIIVGETVFFEVYNPNPVSGMAFFVKDCTVSDSEGRSHDIIADNCADRATASSYYTDKVVTDRSRHSYTAFIFTGNDDVETTLSLTCNIVACLESECSNLISECSRRKRRSAVPQSQQYTTTVTKVFRK